MSFSSDCKTEMCKTPAGRDCCIRAELYGCFIMGLKFAHDEITVMTGHKQFAERLIAMTESGFSQTVTVQQRGTKMLLTVDDPAVPIAAFGHDKSLRIAVHMNRAVIEDDCCASAFIRGAFLAGGFVSNPSKKYHLELVTPHVALSRQIDALLSEHHLPPKLTKRSGHRVLYYKDSELIEDFLTMCGAPVHAMELMDAKIEKGVRNDINRRVNCETANLEKTIGTGAAQCEVIRRLMSSSMWDELPETLKHTARLRLENPEDTLSELAERANIGRSGMNHRLRKIMGYKNV